MSIQSEITQLNTNLDNCYAVCEGLGATMPADKNFDNLEDTIASIVRDVDYIINNGSLVWANPKIYLSNDASNYIDTGLLLSNNSKIRCVCALSASAITADHGWRAAGSAYTNAGFGIGTGSSDQNPLYYYYTGSGQALSGYNMKDTNKHTLILDKNKAYFDGTLVRTYTEATFQNTGTNTAGIFSRRQSENKDYWNGKIYSCEFWENNTLTGHFVPVPQGLVIGNYTCPSNGMFDIVSQTFFANQGSGTFTYGKDN